MSKYLYYWLLCLIALGATGCLSEDDVSQTSSTSQTKAEFKVLSVVSHQSGQAISLSLDLQQSGEDLRSVQAREESASGALDMVAVGATEQMHLYLYKEGDPASLSTATVTWQGRTETSIKLEKIDFRLAPGYSFRVGDNWLVAGVLGGKLDPQTGRIQMGTPRSASVANAFAKDAMVDMPYALAWQKLNIPRDNYGVIPQTTLQPMGTLLRLHFYSGMAEDYTASMLQLETNALRPTGVFDPTSDKSLGALPRWTAEEAESNTPLVWNYRLGGTGRSLTLPAGSSYAPERTLYLWGMPTAVPEASTNTSIRLDVVPTLHPGTSTMRTTYEKRGHRMLKSGHSYRLSNELSSDLMISEIYYQFSKQNQDPANSKQQNYSIVELYNPTASEIDLSDYALARLTYGGASYNNQYVYTAQGEASRMSSLDPRQAQMLALSNIMGTANDLDGFSTMMGTNIWNDANTPRYKVVYGTPSLRLKPGQTILLAADGYIGRDMKPSKNIEQFNAALASNSSLASNPTAVKDIEKHYHPRAGMQIDSAVRAGYAQSMVAMDNSRYIKTAPSLTSGSGVLLMDNGDGIALFKRVYTAEKGRDLHLVDITAPVGNATASATYRQKLVTEYNQQVKTPISALDTQAPIAYSIVRTVKSSFPRRELEASEWGVAVSENGGVKSLGTRHYVAGLSPFAPEYTGYNASNNPKGLPFWGSRSFTAPPAKQWDALLPTGENVFTDGIADVTGEFVPARVASATATEEQDGYLIGSSYDGNLATYYHSKNRSQNPSFPITLTYNLSQAETISYILYHPRDYYGSIKRVEVQVTYEDGTQALVLNTDLGAPTSPTRITWPGIESRKIKSVSFKVHNTPYGVLAVSEMEFMTRSQTYMDTSTIFADVLHTQLRPGITYAEIMAIPEPFYRELARQIYQGTYPREFRIAGYKSYPDPSVQRDYNRTQYNYSLYDNPTGISVQRGERIIVWVDNPSGNPISLAVHDFNLGGGTQQYKLNHGANILNMSYSGLLYILYHSREMTRGALPEVRVHIAGGKVNGYYDSENPKHRGRWTELLSKAVDPHFDVLSRYAHLIYPTQKFRNLVADPAPLLAMYERFIIGEWELMGLVKYGRTFNNRMECRVMYDAYMNATNYRTAYNTSTMHIMMNPERMSQEPWGAAHEMGHINQTVGFNWGGMIEVTVNVFASYVQFVTLGNTFRGLQPGEDWFTRGWNRLLEKPGVTLSMMSKDGDPVTSMFQLELYLGQVLGKTPTKMADKGGFYPELFELLRQANASINNTTDKPDFNGNQQADFVYYASKAAGLDLTDFFERWGYLRPVNDVGFVNTYDHKFRITLTQQKVDEVKAKIRSLGLPKPGVAFEYITTRNMDMFRTPRPVVPGTATRDDQTLRFTGWQNVVAWEVVDASGRLVYTSTGWHQDFSANVAGFSLPDNIPWQTSYRVRAISATGQRTVVAL